VQREKIKRGKRREREREREVEEEGGERK